MMHVTISYDNPASVCLCACVFVCLCFCVFVCLCVSYATPPRCFASQAPKLSGVYLRPPREVVTVLFFLNSPCCYPFYEYSNYL